MTRARWVVAVALAAACAVFARYGAAVLPAQRLGMLVAAGMALAALPAVPTGPRARLALIAWVVTAWIGALLGPRAVWRGIVDAAIFDVLLLGSVAWGAALWQERGDALGRRAWQVLGVAAAVAVGWGALQLVGVFPTLVDPYGAADASGGLGLSNFTAEWAVLVAALVAALAFGQPGARTVTWAGLAVALAFALGSQARAATLAAAAAMATPWALAAPRRRLPLLVVGAVLAAAAIAWIARDDAPLQYRLFVHRDAAVMVAHEPGGVGVGGFATALDAYLSPQLDLRSWERNVELRSPHDLWLLAASERGWLGCAALAWALALTVRRLWRRRHDPHMRLLAGAAAAFAVVASASIVADVAPLLAAGGWVFGAIWSDRLAGGQQRRWVPWVVAACAVILATYGWRELVREQLLRDAIVYEHQGRGVVAERLLIEAAARDPGDFRAAYNTAILRTRGGDLKGALESLGAVAAARPSLERAYEAQTILAAEVLDWATVRAATAQWFATPGYHGPELYYGGALGAIADKDYASAERIVGAGLDRHPGHAELTRTLARIYMLTERWSAAVPLLETLSGGADAAPSDAEWLAIARAGGGR